MWGGGGTTGENPRQERVLHKTERGRSKERRSGNWRRKRAVRGTRARVLCMQQNDTDGVRRGQAGGGQGNGGKYGAVTGGGRGQVECDSGGR